MLQMNYSSLIFPEIQALPQVLGDPRLRADVLLQIQSDPGTYAIFQSFTSQEQEAFLGFCMGEGDGDCLDTGDQANCMLRRWSGRLTIWDLSPIIKERRNIYIGF